MHVLKYITDNTIQEKGALYIVQPCEGPEQPSQGFCLRDSYDTLGVCVSAPRLTNARYLPTPAS